MQTTDRERERERRISQTLLFCSDSGCAIPIQTVDAVRREQQQRLVWSSRMHGDLVPRSFVRSFVPFFLLWLPPDGPLSTATAATVLGRRQLHVDVPYRSVKFCPPLSWREQPGLWIDDKNTPPPPHPCPPLCFLLGSNLVVLYKGFFSLVTRM